MKYDITAKRLLEIGKESILKYFLSIDVESAEILEELPEETVSIRSTDFPIKIREKTGEEYILLFEIQSNWKLSKIYDLIDYWARFKRKYNLPVKCAMLLLNKNENAKDNFVFDGITFKFQLIKMWELNAEDIIKSENAVLLPFVPLSKNGTEFVDSAVEKIYNCNIDREIKSDFVTALAFFTGMRNIDLARALFLKRRDFMIESPVYDWIVEEGVKKGLNQGLEQGLEQGGKQKAVDSAKKMLAKGYSIYDISEITDLSIERIKELKSET